MRYKNIIERFKDRDYKSLYLSMIEKNSKILNTALSQIDNDINNKYPDIRDSLWWGLTKSRILDSILSIIKDPWYFDTYKDACAVAQEKYQSVMGLIDEAREHLEHIEKEYSSNRIKFAEFTKGPSMFFVAEDINDSSSKNYYFAYEISPSEDGMSFDAFVHSGLNCKGEHRIFKATEYRIRPMTREEFEGKFIIPHLGNFRMNIKETVEYDNYIRNLFNQSEK